MGYQTGFRGPGDRVPDGVREKFWKALQSGLSPTAAATVAGVAGLTGRKWAKAAGYQTNPKHYGIRYSAEVRDAFWEALRTGATPTQAAVIAGVSEHTALRWVDQAGYVPRTPIPAGEEPDAASRSMSFVERCRLEELLVAGYTQAGAARLLGRHPSTIGREVCRGATSCGYRARIAQDAVDANRARPKARKLESRPALLAEVVRRLQQRHSPEQIAGRLREDFPDDPEMWVSHETIYQAMYVQPAGTGPAGQDRAAHRKDATKTAGPQRYRRPQPVQGRHGQHQ
ncbi:hypothetical protein MSHI_03730 [Mycobacterium shinjukuense]|uniref:Transposase IS30-like HTH domain-containing protein n=1 Tax=Mycobacterium shinjukuense TaxID=398694 RepID=A0A7I7MKZ7_9MYCO|nr:hypothetical protein MSHI_03730 [Mycobacterium shinjukuense]